MDSAPGQAALLRFVFSTKPIADDRLEDAIIAAIEPQAPRPPRPLIHNIGRGTRSSVFQMRCTNRVLKLGKSLQELVRDCMQSLDVSWAMEACAPALVAGFDDRHGLRISAPKIPRFYSLYEDCADMVARQQELASFENGKTSDDPHLSEIGHVERSQPGFIMERIPAILNCAREALIDFFFDPEGCDHFLNHIESQDCLVRLYFGRQSHDAAIASMRNFPLYVDQMKDIGLDTETWVVELAVGLAVIHWGARLDGMGVEFVLSSSTPRNLVPAIPSAPRRGTQLWIFGFEKARPLMPGFPRAWIRQLVAATAGNDPYFPRPDVDNGMWRQFSDAYIHASQIVLSIRSRMEVDIDQSMLGLPAQFIDALYRHYDENPGY